MSAVFESIPGVRYAYMHKMHVPEMGQRISKVTEPLIDADEHKQRSS